MNTWEVFPAVEYNWGRLFLTFQNEQWLLSFGVALLSIFFFTYSLASVVVLLHSFKFYCPLCLSSMRFCNGSEIKKKKIDPQHIFGTVFNSLSILCDHSLFSARRERG